MGTGERDDDGQHGAVPNLTLISSAPQAGTCTAKRVRRATHSQSNVGVRRTYAPEVEHELAEAGVFGECWKEIG